nr:hypothetical protein CFP56_36420 [Quercus suber]
MSAEMTVRSMPSPGMNHWRAISREDMAAAVWRRKRTPCTGLGGGGVLVLLAVHSVPDGQKGRKQIKGRQHSYLLLRVHGPLIKIQRPIRRAEFPRAGCAAERVTVQIWREVQRSSNPERGKALAKLS